MKNESQQIYTSVKQQIMRPSPLILLLRLPLPYDPKGYSSIIEWNLEIKKRKQREELYPILFCVWTLRALLLFYGVSVWGSEGQESSWMNSIMFLSLLVSKLKEVVGDNLHTLSSVPTRYAVTTLLRIIVLPQFY